MPLKKPAELYINIEMINRNKTYKRSHKQSPKPVKNINIYNLLINNNFLVFIKNEHWLINVCIILNFLGYLYFVFRNNFDNFQILFLDLLLILLINFAFSPLLAFTIYFCFLHSIRHIISIVLELDQANFSNGIKLFIKKALPLTIITAILYLLAVFFIANFYGFNTAIMQVIFIGLASLTFPHILLEYLIEKNIQDKMIKIEIKI